MISQNILNVVQLNSKIKLGHFDIDFVTLTHSILEPIGLSFTTSWNNTSRIDWKIDPNPLIGRNIDERKKLKEKLAIKVFPQYDLRLNKCI